MKNLLLLSLLLCSLIWGGCSKDDVPAPSYDADVVIPDEVFRRFCLENYDTDGDGRLSAAEARAVREMYCHDPGIGSMEGIERFTRLEVFDCTYSYGLRGLDLSGNGNLVSVSCKDCWNLSSLNVSQCGALRKLNCDGCSLPWLDVTRNPVLERLSCRGNGLSMINLSRNPELRVVDLYGNRRQHVSRAGQVECRLGADALFESESAYKLFDSLRRSRLPRLTVRKDPR